MQQTNFNPMAAYAALWDRYSHELGQGRAGVDVDGPGEPIYTLVSRLPPDIAEAALEALSDTGADWSPHYMYPPSEVHLTILFVSPYLDLSQGLEGSAEEEMVRSACRPLAAVLGQQRPLRLEALGLNIFATTVFLQLIQEVPNAPRKLRKDLAEALKADPVDRPSAAKYETALAWDLVFANLVRFREPTGRDIVSAVSHLRKRQFGEVAVRELELVKTDKLLSCANTKTLERFSLGDG